jgi:hypothetical protein
MKLSFLPDLSGRLILIDVFANPERFRFSFVGEQLSCWSKESMVGKFADEMQPRTPFDYLRSQYSATVEGRKPPFFTIAQMKPVRSRVSSCRCGETVE